MTKFSKDDDDVFYTTYITLRNGKRLYAWQKGLKVFCCRKKKKKGDK
jgi:hypothetical protein